MSRHAEACINGLTLNSDKYEEAISALQSKNGNTQIPISAYICYMDTLVNIRKVKNFDDVINLRSLYNDAENCELDLKILKVEASSYESLLNLILKERLPHDLNLLISRKFGNEIMFC